MTFRVTPTNVLDVVRELVDQIDVLKRQTGTVKQNTIRLGDWVLEAVDDSLVRMTNLVSGEESYIGGVGDGGGDTIVTQTIVPEFPPFCVGGVVRIAFGNPIRTNVYTVPTDITITTIVATIASVGGGNGGIVFTLTKNGSLYYTSPTITGNKTVLSGLNLPFAADDDVYLSVTDDGDGDSTGFQVMFRR